MKFFMQIEPKITIDLRDSGMIPHLCQRLHQGALRACPQWIGSDQLLQQGEGLLRMACGSEPVC